jgi:Uma2 family endonuclease
MIAEAILSPALLPLARLTCDRYHAMIASGLFHEDERLELIDGYLVKKMSICSNHAGVVNALNRLLNRSLGDRVIVAVQNPISIHEYSEPEPDLVIAKFREDFYAKSHPQPEDVLLVIEVADTSLDYDLKAKVPLYAAAGIPEVWLVNLNDHTLTVFHQPEGIAYLQSTRLTAEDSVSVPGYPDICVPLAQIGLGA